MKLITVKRQFVEDRVRQHGEQYRADLRPAITSETPQSFEVDTNHPAFRSLHRYRQQDRMLGPGGELSALLHRLGLRSNACCDCQSRADEMDRRGISWCQQNLDTIVGWLRDEAESRKMIFADYVARLLVRRAIKLAMAALAKRQGSSGV